MKKKFKIVEVLDEASKKTYFRVDTFSRFLYLEGSFLHEEKHTAEKEQRTLQRQYNKKREVNKTTLGLILGLLLTVLGLVVSLVIRIEYCLILSLPLALVGLLIAREYWDNLKIARR